MKTREAIEQLGQAIERERFFLDQLTLYVNRENLKKVLAFFKNNAGFDVLMDFSGVDYLEPKCGTEVFYWLHHSVSLERVRVVIFVERGGSLPTVTDLWKGANWNERELYDLFGVHFEDHPDLTRILMPDDWIGHPLQKDYPLTEEPVEFKHGVKPKVPSQIIDYGKNRL